MHCPLNIFCHIYEKARYKWQFKPVDMECLVSYFINFFNMPSPRWAVFSRILAATLGGYALATSSALFIGQLLLSSAGKYQAIHIGLLLSFLVYACAAMWVFSVSSAAKSWIGLIKCNLVFLLGTWLLMQFAGASH
jgi:hypothetical protein